MEKNESIWHKAIPIKEQARIIQRIFQFAKPFRKYFTGAIVFALALATINVFLPKIIQLFMDRYLTKGLANWDILFGFGALYFAGVLFKSVVWFLQAYWYSNASLLTLQSVRVHLFKYLHTLGMRYFDQTPAGSIVSRVTNDTETLFEFWYVFLTVLTGMLAVISSFIAMFMIDWKIAVCLLLFLPILVFVIWYYQKYSSRIYRQMRERLSQMNTKLNESISGIQIIQQFRQEQRMNAEFEHTNEEYYQTRTAMIRVNSLLLSPIINLLYTLALALSLSLFGVEALKNPVAVGMIYAFVSYVQAFFNPMTQMMDYLSVFTDGIVASSRILRILDDPEKAPAQLEDPAAHITQGKIEFQHVSFSYDGKHPVLNDITFTAEPGQTIAFVGHTGSGKSSIINVLMRFYEFQKGKVLIDGQDLKTIPLKELRRKLGLVLQDPFMFYGDIAQNIRLLDPSISDQEVREAAEFVQADSFIRHLPGGYHAKVIERGAEYSSGERQLISFARTIVTNPKILILDEATANIDTETEALIQKSLEKMRKGRTTIAIAHRLSTIRDADQILVLDQGEIVERGTHAELLAQKGRYFDMYELQQMQAEEVR